jgi:histidinol dehydrogenase
MFPTYRIDQLTEEERRQIVARGARDLPQSVKEAVAEVIADTRERGDQALLDQAQQFDNSELSSLKVSEQEIRHAGEEVSEEVREALDVLLESLRAHHQHQVGGPGSWSIEPRPGLLTGERTLPLPDVALYVPGGKGRFPSVMAMLGVPAVLAGVRRIVVCSPAANSRPDPATLYVANQLGIEEIFTIGGAGAIAAVAFGTETVPKVSKVLGPGSAYVDEAKRQLSAEIDTGPPAGPSESAIIADDQADPVTVARELIVEAEHGPDSRVLLAMTSLRSVQEVSRLAQGMIERLPYPRRQYAKQAIESGPSIVHGSVPEIISLVNEFAPEHLRLLTADNQAIYQQIENAGEVLLGPWSSISLGNYIAGVNAVLPTSGFARSLSCLGVSDFCKTNSVVECGKDAARELARHAISLADYEGFPAHRSAAKDLLPD